MLAGRRFLLDLTPEQEQRAIEIADVCRAVWNTALEQRREYARRGAIITAFDQCSQVVDAKRDIPWLQGAPAHCLQAVLRDLEHACRKHGTYRIRWKSKIWHRPTFRYTDPQDVRVRRLNRRWGSVRLLKIGWVRFRWTRPVGGTIRNATVVRDGTRWYVSFCVEDGVVSVEPNGKPPIGVDRGVASAVVASNTWARDRKFVSPGEVEHLRRLQQKLCRQKNKQSKRRSATRMKIAAIHTRIRARRADFNAWTANRLTRNHGLVAIEDMKIAKMTRSARGTVDIPGRNVRAKAGLNRSILSKGWGGLLRQLEHKARYNGSEIVKVNPAYTSQTCYACKHIASESRESQAVFRCVACGHQDNADVNAAKNILAAGLAVTGRGDLANGRSAKRQPSRMGTPAAAGLEVNSPTPVSITSVTARGNVAHVSPRPR